MLDSSQNAPHRAQLGGPWFALLAIVPLLNSPGLGFSVVWRGTDQHNQDDQLRSGSVATRSRSSAIRLALGVVEDWAGQWGTPVNLVTYAASRLKDFGKCPQFSIIVIRDNRLVAPPLRLESTLVTQRRSTLPFAARAVSTPGATAVGSIRPINPHTARLRMTSFETAAHKFLDTPSGLEEQSEIEHLMLQTPGLCLIVSASALIRRRLMACMATVEIRKQVDSAPKSATSISIFANGDAAAMTKSLIRLDALFDPNEVDLMNHDLFETLPATLDNLGALSIACSGIGDAEPDGADSSFPPLHFDHKVFTFSSLLHSIQQAKAGSVFFVENVHVLTPLNDGCLVSSLRDLRNLAYANDVYVYVGGCTADTFPGATSCLDQHSPLHPSIAGTETFADTLFNLYLDAEDAVCISHSTSNNISWSGVKL